MQTRVHVKISGKEIFVICIFYILKRQTAIFFKGAPPKCEGGLLGVFYIMYD